MLLQTLFAVSAVVPAITAFVPSPIDPSGVDGLGSARSERPLSRSALNFSGGFLSTAEVIPAKSASFDSRYPGAVVIATAETRDRAFLVASRMAEIGVTVLMYTQEDGADRTMLMYEAHEAVDSMRRRTDVRREELGIIAFEEATTVVPDLVRDTTISFAIAASGSDRTHDISRRYAEAHAATLLVQGVDTLGNADALVKLLNEPTESADPSAAPAPANDQAVSDQSTPAPTQTNALDDTGVPSAPVNMAPNVTVWPVPRSQLARIGEAHSPLGLRLVSWIREQVHAPAPQQAKSINVH